LSEDDEEEKIIKELFLKIDEICVGSDVRFVLDALIMVAAHGLRALEMSNRVDRFDYCIDLLGNLSFHGEPGVKELPPKVQDDLRKAITEGQFGGFLRRSGVSNEQIEASIMKKLGGTH
jgi:hypothetical protein